MQITFYGATDIGRKRTNNEDAFIAQQIWDEDHLLLVAIDGMGGEEGGEVAAEIAAGTIVDYLSKVVDDTSLNLIKTAMAEANNAIVEAKEEQARYQRMGCVATAGIFDLKEQTLSIAHVGDSRLYRFSHGVLTKLTHDHSLVGYQEEQGILTEEQAMNHPRRSVIERCLGAEVHTPEDKHFIEAGIFPLTNGEIYLFCSDGLCDVLTSDEISACLGQGQTPKAECKRLIDAANNASGKDNITVVIAHVGKPSDAKRNAHKPIPAKVKAGKRKARANAAKQAETDILQTAQRVYDTPPDDYDMTMPNYSESYDKPARKNRIWLFVISNIISLLIGVAVSYFFFGKADEKGEPAPSEPKREIVSTVKEDTLDNDTSQQSVEEVSQQPTEDQSNVPAAKKPHLPVVSTIN